MSEKIDIEFRDIKVGDFIEVSRTFEIGDYSVQTGRVVCTSSSSLETYAFRFYSGDKSTFKKIIEPVVEPAHIGAVVEVTSKGSDVVTILTRASTLNSYPWVDEHFTPYRWDDVSNHKILSHGYIPDEVSS